MENHSRFGCRKPCNHSNYRAHFAHEHFSRQIANHIFAIWRHATGKLVRADLWGLTFDVFGQSNLIDSCLVMVWVLQDSWADYMHPTWPQACLPFFCFMEVACVWSVMTSWFHQRMWNRCQMSGVGPEIRCHCAQFCARRPGRPAWLGWCSKFGTNHQKLTVLHFNMDVKFNMVSPVDQKFMDFLNIAWIPYVDISSTYFLASVCQDLFVEIFVTKGSEHWWAHKFESKIAQWFLSFKLHVFWLRVFNLGFQTWRIASTRNIDCHSHVPNSIDRQIRKLKCDTKLDCRRHFQWCDGQLRVPCQSGLLLKGVAMISSWRWQRCWNVPFCVQGKIQICSLRIVRKQESIPSILPKGLHGRWWLEQFAGHAWSDPKEQNWKNVIIQLRRKGKNKKQCIETHFKQFCLPTCFILLATFNADVLVHEDRLLVVFVLFFCFAIKQILCNRWC